MSTAAAPDPAVRPGALDEILSDLAQQGIEPTRSNVIRAALDRRHPADFAAALADAAERRQQGDAEK